MKWYPIKVAYPFGMTMVELEKYPEYVFDYPFLVEGVHDFKKKTEKFEKMIMPLEEYRTYLSKQEISSPKGFIFHPSRSGSTLICQMLNEIEDCRVISEPTVPLIFYKEAMINRKGDFDKNELKTLILGLLVQNEKKYNHGIIKFTSWAIDLLPTIVEIFPNTPWVYVYRNPIEIFTSALNKPSRVPMMNKTEPNVLVNQIEGSIREIEAYDKETFLSKLTRYNFEMALTQSSKLDNRSLLINYIDIKKHFYKILSHFNIEIGSIGWEKIMERSKYYSKSNQLQKFESDVKRKQAKVTPQIKKAINAELLIEFYQQLIKHS